MKQPIDIGRERKKRQRTQRVRRLTILFLIFLSILVALYINDVLVKKDVTSQIGGFVDTVGGDGYPAPLPSGSIQNMGNVGSNLVILKDSNLYIYNKNGKQIENIQQMKERSVMLTKGDRVLYYDIGGNLINVHTAAGEVYKQNFSYNIDMADLGANGEVAVVTWPPNFVAEITVYTPKGEAFYSRQFSERLVSHVSVSPKGKQMAVATLGSDNGIFDTIIMLFQLDSEEKEGVRLPLPDHLVLWMEYQQEDTLLILTDGAYYIYDHTGSLVGNYLFPDTFELLSFHPYQGEIGLLGRNSETRDFEFVLLNDTASEKERLVFQGRPLDIQVGNKSVFMLESTGIKEYNHQLNLVEEYLIADVQRIYLLKEKLYLFMKNEIRLVDKKMGV